MEKNFRFFYWRTQTGIEVDLILARGASDIPRAIEIKSKTNPTTEDLKGLKAFHKEHPKAKLFCLSQADKQYEVDGIKILPWHKGLVDILNG